MITGIPLYSLSLLNPTQIGALIKTITTDTNENEVKSAKSYRVQYFVCHLTANFAFKLIYLKSKQATSHKLGNLI